MPAIKDIWPPEIFTAPKVTPIAVLRQHGETLGAHTHNFVHGEVETTSSDDGKQFEHTLYLSAPLLRYRKPLLRVIQPQLAPYPATVMETELTKLPEQNHWSRSANDEIELQECLQEFLNETRVKELLRWVINMSNDVVPPENEVS